jgi:hypothetical protein
MWLTRTILVGADNMATDPSTLEWHLRDQLDDAWRAYGQAALELRRTMRESDIETMSHSSDYVSIKNATKRRDAAYKTYQQIFNTLTDFRHRSGSAIDRGHKFDEPCRVG